ncbi:MAG: hypothetical protein ABEL97_11815 [Salinibacter sp.]
MLDRVYEVFAAARRAWVRFSESRIGEWVLSGLRWAFLAGIVSYLAYQLTTIGWAELWASMPTTPWFYVLLLLMYATLPVTEMVLYGTAWGARHRDLLPALLRKRVLNNEVLGYSGEAYFYVWARRETNLDALDVLRTIKDNVIISSVASTSVAFSLLAIFFLTGQIELLRQYLPNETSTVAAGIAVIILVVSVGVNFRRALFSLPSRVLWLIGGGHLLRFVLNNGFQVLQWAVVIPEVSAGTWITLLALYIVIQQIPFVPSRGLVFMSAGVGLSGALQIPTAALASMLLTTSLIDRTLNFATYVGTTALEAATVEDAEALEDLSFAEEMKTAEESSS